ncbi:unnamed protein product [Dovyalis caffra]|uniref:Large ribosomal subunit protein eL20 domain-containing protein n=1 Tax=Dovyalis caffra TaxID=77055 RepID=A0AAV1S8T6_9ROSI|nr:unnamed protein product [Dovyalis caffra]
MRKSWAGSSRYHFKAPSWPIHGKETNVLNPHLSVPPEPRSRGKGEKRLRNPYFLRKLKKVKKRNGQILVINESRTGYHNMYKEYRDTTLNGAVEQMYTEMASRHRNIDTNVSSQLIFGEDKDLLNHPELNFTTLETWNLTSGGVGGTIVDSGTTAGCEKMELPDFGILFAGGAVWNFPVENYFIRLVPEAILGTPRSTLSIIGSYQRQNFLILYDDNKKSRLGYAPMKCADV